MTIDNNNNTKKKLVLWAKQLLCMCITLFSTFLWHPLHDYDVKPPNAMFYGGCGHTTTNFPSSIWTWINHLRIQLQEKLPTFDELSCSKKKIEVIKFERRQIHLSFLVMFSLPSLSSLLKIPINTDGGEGFTNFMFRNTMIWKRRNCRQSINSS